MKKFTFIIALLVLAVMGAHAGDIGGMYYKSGTNTTVVIPAGDGVPVITSGNIYFTGAGDTAYKRYWASSKTTIQASTNVASTTNLTVVVDTTETNNASPKIQGYIPTTDDWVIVGGLSSNSLQQITVVGGVANYTTNALGNVKSRATLSVGTSISVVEGGAPVYLIKSENIVSQTLTSAQVNLQDHGIGFRNMPFAVGQAHTGTVGEISGTYEYWKKARN